MLEKNNFETQIEVTDPQEKIQGGAKYEDAKSENNNWLRHRLERAKEQGVKQVLEQLGGRSVEEISKKLSGHDEYEKEIRLLHEKIAKAKNLEFKIEAMKGGIDEKFVDFVVHSLKEKVTEKEDFSSILEKFKNENPQYLKSQTSGIKISTAPNFENTSAHQKTNDIINKLIRGE